MTADLVRGAAEGIYLFALCHVLARVEIHIEGAHGWAVNLPTWRWGPEWWLNMTNGKELTGYHVWLTLFLIGMFHLPLAFSGFTLALWAKCLSSYMMVTAAWDLQWFVWNPAWGFAALRARDVPWFRRKVAGLPVDYFMGYAVSGALTALIWAPGMAHWAGRAGAVLLLSALSIPAARLSRPGGVMSVAILMAVWLTLAGSVHGESSKPAPTGRELYESRVSAWKESRNTIQGILDRLRPALQNRPAALAAVDQLVTRWRQNQSLQNALQKQLVKNQAEALSAGAIDRERHDIHVAKLDRLLEERMLILWGHDAPAEINETLKKHAVGALPQGYPFPVYPSAEEWKKFHMKDFVPIYDKAENRMKTQQE